MPSFKSLELIFSITNKTFTVKCSFQWRASLQWLFPLTFSLRSSVSWLIKASGYCLLMLCSTLCVCSVFNEVQRRTTTKCSEMDQTFVFFVFLTKTNPFKNMSGLVLILWIILGSSFLQWPLTLPSCPQRFSIVFKTALSPAPVTSSLQPHRQLLFPSIFNVHYLEMNDCFKCYTSIAVISLSTWVWKGSMSKFCWMLWGTACC